MKNERFETSDLGIACALYASGIRLIEIRHDPDRGIFIFEQPLPDILLALQSGSLMVNALAYRHAQNELKARVSRGGIHG